MATPSTATAAPAAAPLLPPADACPDARAAALRAPTLRLDARTFWEVYWLPQHGQVTLADLERRAEPWAAAGYRPCLEWLTDEGGAIVGVALSAKPGVHLRAEQVDAFREAAGADLAHALGEWEPA